MGNRFVLFTILLDGKIEDNVRGFVDGGGTGCDSISKFVVGLESSILEPNGFVVFATVRVLSWTEEPEVANNEGIGSGSAFGRMWQIVATPTHQVDGDGFDFFRWWVGFGVGPVEMN